MVSGSWTDFHLTTWCVCARRGGGLLARLATAVCSAQKALQTLQFKVYLLRQPEANQGCLPKHLRGSPALERRPAWSTRCGDCRILYALMYRLSVKLPSETTMMAFKLGNWRKTCAAGKAHLMWARMAAARSLFRGALHSDRLSALSARLHRLTETSPLAAALVATVLPLAGSLRRSSSHCTACRRPQPHPGWRRAAPRR